MKIRNELLIVVLSLFCLTFSSCFKWASRNFDNYPKETALDKTYNYKGKVIIIGAGASGLAAAKILEQNNIDYQILEATDRYGGRLKKNETLADFPIDIGAEWIHNLPPILNRLKGKKGDEFIKTAQQKLSNIQSQTMLTTGISQSYINGTELAQNANGVETVFGSNSTQSAVLPTVLSTDSGNWLKTPALRDEIFGPYAMVLRTQDVKEIFEIAQNLEGQLTATVFLTPDDHDSAKTLMPILEQKAGRILANGYPTGVEVAESMVHGGPYPASTFVGTTSVGTTAIQRFLRPVCYQNMPKSLLPKELQ